MIVANSRRNTVHQVPVSCWTWSSPVGDVLLIADARGLRGLHFQHGPHPLTPDPAWDHWRQPFQEIIPQLEDYFAGRLQTFHIPLSLQGSPFQLGVWQALQHIPYGSTASYGDIAGSIGNPNASRAVGAANGQNPVSIIVPCHRVIGKKGDLVGYGGGLHIKEALLDLERRGVKGNAAS
jgi:methylated-DNA-[protein]-cysteine S-methyltransferase